MPSFIRGSKVVTFGLLLLLLQATGKLKAENSAKSGNTQAVLIVLKNQPAREILGRLRSSEDLQRRFAEDNLRSLSVQPGVSAQTKLDAAGHALQQRAVLVPRFRLVCGRGIAGPGSRAGRPNGGYLGSDAWLY